MAPTTFSAVFLLVISTDNLKSVLSRTPVINTKIDRSQICYFGNLAGQNPVENDTDREPPNTCRQRTRSSRFYPGRITDVRQICAIHRVQVPDVDFFMITICASLREIKLSACFMLSINLRDWRRYCSSSFLSASVSFKQKIHHLRR